MSGTAHVLLMPVCSTLMQSTKLTNTGSAMTSLSWTHLQRCSSSAPWWLPKAAPFFWGWTRLNRFWSRLLHLSLPLKPQGLQRLSLREKKKQTKKKLTTWTCTSPPPFFSFFLHHWMVLKGREWSESLQSHRQCVYTWLSVAVVPDLGLWSWFSPL